LNGLTAGIGCYFLLHWVLKIYIAELFMNWGCDALVHRCIGYSILLVCNGGLKKKDNGGVIF